LGEAEDAHWKEYFQTHNISPLELIYEELTKDLEGTVRRVLEFLGIPAEDVRVPPPTLRQQADQRSQEWELRYRRMDMDESA
jgi:LPS sulfotransferase NodH